MVEGAGLDNRWALTGLEGSNPSLSVVLLHLSVTQDPYQEDKGPTPLPR